VRTIDDDILSQGGDRQPTPRWRRRALTVALVLAVAGGGADLAVTRHQPAPAAAPRPSASASPVPAAGAGSLPAEPDGITGQTLAWEAGLRLPVAGTQPAWFSPASGAAQPVGGLPGGHAYKFTRVAGGWAVQASPDAPAGCGGCAGPAGPVWFLAGGAHAVTPLGTANLVAPAAEPGRVWLVSYPPDAKLATAAGTAREVSTTGALAPPVRLPAGYSIYQGTSRGLVLTPPAQQPGAAAELWDPSGARARQTFPGLLAASPGAIAWAPRCTRQCSVQILDLATGRHTAAKLTAGSSPVSADFSPDSRFLAVQESFGNTGDSGELAMQLEVAPAATGRLSAVPGTWVSSDALVGFGWPDGGDHLVAEFSFTTKMQLASWHPGASRPAVALLRPGPDQGALILG
jgi:hypothetical protein